MATLGEEKKEYINKLKSESIFWLDLELRKLYLSLITAEYGISTPCEYPISYPMKNRAEKIGKLMEIEEKYNLTLKEFKSRSKPKKLSVNTIQNNNSLNSWSLYGNKAQQTSHLDCFDNETDSLPF